MRKQKLIIPFEAFSPGFCNSVFRSEITPCITSSMGVRQGWEVGAHGGQGDVCILPALPRFSPSGRRPSFSFRG